MKTVNWAKKQMDKINETLCLEANDTSDGILNQGNKSARWIAFDTIREFNNEMVIKRKKIK
ncbi:MAG: hypothetical protein ACYC25_11775 [Paludibacter sp.]